MNDALVNDRPSATQDGEAEPPSSSFLTQLRTKIFGRKNGDATLKEALEEAIEEVLEEHEEENAAHTTEETSLLRNAIQFSELCVKDLMIPRTDIIAVPKEITLDALKKHIIEQRHTRTPIYSGTFDQMLGFLHVKDLVAILAGDKPYDLSGVLRRVLFVPPSMKAIDLLVKMRKEGSHIAIVVDEHGGTDGLVTLEDIVEELVGEIHDEHDEEENRQQILRVDPNAWEVNARIPIERLEEALGISLAKQEDEEYDTLAGLIFFQLGRVPVKGETVKHQPSGLNFIVTDTDTRRIRRVRIVKPVRQ